MQAAAKNHIAMKAEYASHFVTSRAMLYELPPSFLDLTFYSTLRP
jgi:hypothetical protein